jgi:T-complex protein 1 subunit gamma
MAISVGLAKKARSIEGVEGWPFRAVSDAMEVIPRTLVQNCGGNAIRVLTTLRVRSFNSVVSCSTDIPCSSPSPPSLHSRRPFLISAVLYNYYPSSLASPHAQAKHAAGEHSYGVDGDTGKVVEMREYGLYESAAVKVQTLKTAIESACLLLRVDEYVSFPSSSPPAHPLTSACLQHRLCKATARRGRSGCSAARSGGA